MGIPCKECNRILDWNKIQEEYFDYKEKKRKNEFIDKTKYKYNPIYDKKNKVVTFHCICGRPIMNDVTFFYCEDDPNKEEKFKEYIMKVEKTRKEEYNKFSKEHHWK